MNSNGMFAHSFKAPPPLQAGPIVRQDLMLTGAQEPVETLA